MAKKILLWLWNLAPMLIMATIALGAWLWLQQKNPVPITQPQIKQHIPDHQIKDLRLDITTADQNRYFRLHAQNAKRMEDTGIISVVAPQLTAFQTSSPPVLLQSSQADVSSDQKQIDLTGNVRLARDKGKFNDTLPSIQLASEHITVLTQDATYNSPGPIVAKTAQSTLQAQSGIYYQQTGLIELKGRVRGKLGGDIMATDLKTQPLYDEQAH